MQRRSFKQLYLESKYKNIYKIIFFPVVHQFLFRVDRSETLTHERNLYAVFSIISNITNTSFESEDKKATKRRIFVSISPKECIQNCFNFMSKQAGSNIKAWIDRFDFCLKLEVRYPDSEGSDFVKAYAEIKKEYAVKALEDIGYTDTENTDII